MDNPTDDFLKTVKTTYSLSDEAYSESVDETLKKILSDSLEYKFEEKGNHVLKELKKLDEQGFISLGEAEFEAIKLLICMKCKAYEMNLDKLSDYLGEVMEEQADKSKMRGDSYEEFLHQFSSSAYGETSESLGGNVRKEIIFGGINITLQCKNDIDLRYDAVDDWFALSGKRPSTMRSLLHKIKISIPEAQISQEEDTTYIEFKKNSSNMRPLMQTLLKEKLIGYGDTERFTDAVNDHSPNLGKE